MLIVTSFKILMAEVCYNKPRTFNEPCGLSAGHCENGLTCPIGGGRCKQPCVPIEKSTAIFAKEDEIKLKKKEMEDVAEDLKGATTFYAAKLRGETQFIAEELQLYYSEKSRYCPDVNIDTSADYADLCNPANYPAGEFEGGGDSCSCASAEDMSVKGEQLCNDDATRAEIIIHDDIILYRKLEKELATLEAQLDSLMKGDVLSNLMKPVCMEMFRMKDAIVQGAKAALAAVVKFIKDAKCIIIKAILSLLGKVVDTLVAKLPFIGPIATALQKNPACGGKKDYKNFKIAVPGAVLTGLKFFKAIANLLCKIGDIDDSLYFFKVICPATEIIVMIVNALLAGLCGKFGTAFIAIAEPFVTCNLWDCGDNDVRVNVPLVILM